MEATHVITNVHWKDLYATCDLIGLSGCFVDQGVSKWNPAFRKGTFHVTAGQNLVEGDKFLLSGVETVLYVAPLELPTEESTIVDKPERPHSRFRLMALRLLWRLFV